LPPPSALVLTLRQLCDGGNISEVIGPLGRSEKTCGALELRGMSIGLEVFEMQELILILAFSGVFAIIHIDKLIAAMAQAHDQMTEPTS
jgi:hypothetical protein